jgi:hypothetical protein
MGIALINTASPSMTPVNRAPLPPSETTETAAVFRRHPPGRSCIPEPSNPIPAIPRDFYHGLLTSSEEKRFEDPDRRNPAGDSDRHRPELAGRQIAPNRSDLPHLGSIPPPLIDERFDIMLNFAPY